MSTTWEVIFRPDYYDFICLKNVDGAKTPYFKAYIGIGCGCGWGTPEEAEAQATHYMLAQLKCDAWKAKYKDYHKVISPPAVDLLCK